MKIWRCEICGDPFLGESKPSDCPFCGAPGRFLARQRIFKDTTGRVEDLSDISRKNLEAALKLEVNATRRYKQSAGNAQTDEIKSFFRAIAKHENEHVNLISKALGITKPEIDINETNASEKEEIIETIQLEDNAITLYAEFLSEAGEARVRQIFTALIAVENNHLQKANQLLAKL